MFVGVFSKLSLNFEEIVISYSVEESCSALQSILSLTAMQTVEPALAPRHEMALFHSRSRLKNP
jgi:hypothetical protein